MTTSHLDKPDFEPGVSFLGGLFGFVTLWASTSNPPQELREKFSVLFSLVGLKTDVLPGIRIAGFVVLGCLEYFRWELLAKMGWYDLPEWRVQLLVFVFSLLGSVLYWFVSGWMFDPLYDWLYGPDKPFTKPGRHFIIFPQGHGLNAHRKSARTKIAQGNPNYVDEDIPI